MFGNRIPCFGLGEHSWWLVSTSGFLLLVNADCQTSSLLLSPNNLQLKSGSAILVLLRLNFLVESEWTVGIYANVKLRYFT